MVVWKETVVCEDAGKQQPSSRPKLAKGMGEMGKSLIQMKSLQPPTSNQIRSLSSTATRQSLNPSTP
jgi:hypothetical protein